MTRPGLILSGPGTLNVDQHSTPPSSTARIVKPSNTQLDQIIAIIEQRELSRDEKRQAIRQWLALL